jgi:hypothetical protein
MATTVQAAAVTVGDVLPADTTLPAATRARTLAALLGTKDAADEALLACVWAPRALSGPRSL